MIRVSPRRPLMGLAVLACVVGLTACGGGGSTNTSQHGAPTTSPLPGARDTAICQVITKATTAYNAKDYVTWRSDMVEIASAADSAQYTPSRSTQRKSRAGPHGEDHDSTPTRSKSKSKAKGRRIQWHRRPVRHPRWFCRSPARLRQASVAGIDFVRARRTS